MEIEEPPKTPPSLETLPLEILWNIAELHLSLEGLLHLTRVSKPLRKVARKYLCSEKYWATSLAFDADHERLGIKKVQSNDTEYSKYEAAAIVVEFIRGGVSRMC